MLPVPRKQRAGMAAHGLALGVQRDHVGSQVLATGLATDRPQSATPACGVRWVGWALLACQVVRLLQAQGAHQGSSDDCSATAGGTVHTSCMGDSLTLTAVFTPDENGWTMAQLAEWPAVVTCAQTLDEARDMLLDAAQEMVASYRAEGREPPIGGGRVESLKIDLAA